jgi:hypothetical protein
VRTIESFTDASPLLADHDALRARFSRDGHLFLRGLLDRDAVLGLRAEVLAAVAALDWLAPGTDADAARPGAIERHEGSREFWEGYIAIQRLESFHRLAHHQALVDAMAVLVGDDVLPHPQKIARLSFPSETFFTAPHQDYRYIQGTADFLTAWIPLGPCPPEHGGLRVLSGSQSRGLLPVHSAEGAGGLAVDVDEDDPGWRTATYEAGDVVVFGSLTVHGAIPNRTDRLRLSVDYRYQSAADAICAPSLGPHFSFMDRSPGWDELSTGWASREWVDVPADLDLVRFSNPASDDLAIPASRFL